MNEEYVWKKKVLKKCHDFLSQTTQALDNFLSRPFCSDNPYSKRHIGKSMKEMGRFFLGVIYGCFFTSLWTMIHPTGFLCHPPQIVPLETTGTRAMQIEVEPDPSPTVRPQAASKSFPVRLDAK